MQNLSYLEGNNLETRLFIISLGQRHLMYIWSLASCFDKCRTTVSTSKARFGETLSIHKVIGESDSFFKYAKHFCGGVSMVPSKNICYFIHLAGTWTKSLWEDVKYYENPWYWSRLQNSEATNGMRKSILGKNAKCCLKMKNKSSGAGGSGQELDSVFTLLVANLGNASGKTSGHLFQANE